MGVTDPLCIPLTKRGSKGSVDMVNVKICGIQEAGDALVAARAGADFVGLVFVPGRRRRLDEDAAQGIASFLREQLEAPPRVVGLFADQELQEVNDVVGRCGLDMVQLCGEESPDYCDRVEVPVIKVLHVSASQEAGDAAESIVPRMRTLRDAGHLITLDRKVEGLQGGTGQSFDWDIAGEMSGLGLAFLLAGGLTPENVSEAVAKARPWGVDVSSGVETRGSPGKDHGRIRAFIQAARSR